MDDERCGEGEFTYNTGDTYRGNWADNKQSMIHLSPPLGSFDRCDDCLFLRAQMGWVSCSMRPMTSTEDTGRMESDMEM